MKEISPSNFGLLIAYVLPGFVAIWGLSGVWPINAGCLDGSAECSLVPSLVGLFNTTVAAIAAGMAVSAVRFVIIDTIHSLTGLKRPYWNGTVLQKNLTAVKSAVDHHYRYYQFHTNMLVAGIVAFGAHLHAHREISGFPELLLLLLAVAFWIAGRDNLRKYYDNLTTIFASQKVEQTAMSNGQHHRDGKPDDKPKSIQAEGATEPSKEKATAQSEAPKKQ